MPLPNRFAALALLAAVGAAPAGHAALPRFPQPTGDRVVFVADGNVWSVPRTGGAALRLTSAPGQDLFPRVSPDGKWIAYTEAGNAGTDAWVIPAAGGAARRLTWHPTVEAGTGGRHAPDNMVVTWTPDSKSVVILSKRDQWNSWTQDAYAVPVAGGAPARMPIDSAVGLMTFGPDGHRIAYNRIFRNFRTWKRYNGGLAQQVFTYDLDTKRLQQVTDWSGTNTSPMWVGGKIYYLSDQDAHRRANIWCVDLATKQTHEVTHFADYDIDFPAYGPDAHGGAIAFQQGGKLWVLDLPGEQLHEVPVDVPDDGARTRPRVADVHDGIREQDMAQQVDFALAPNGKRSLFSARGDIFSVPTEHGAARNLTTTPGVDEDHPAFSPDGKTVAYTTDGSGNQQVATRPAEGGPEKRLTSFKDGYLYGPLWSPDGKSLAVSDGAHRLWLVPAGGGAPRHVAQDRLSEIHDQAFSPDSRWLAFSMAVAHHQRRRDLYLYEIATGHTTRLGAGDATDNTPLWSPDGKYLFFQSNRHENTVLSDAEFDFSILKSNGIYAIPLAADTPSPLAPRSDEADTHGDDAAPAPPKPGDKGADKHTDKPVRVDLADMMARAVALPIDPANVAQMDARDGKLFYLTQPIQLIEGVLKGEKSALHVYDFSKRKDEVVAEDVDSYALALDGKTVLIRHEKDYTVLDAKPDATKDHDATHKLDLAHLRAAIDPRAEWAEMFDNAWRLQRDMFYSPVMNGVDWRGVHDSYAKLLPKLGSREDLNWLIGQVNGELGNSHTYVGGGDDGDTGPKVKPALLGVDWSLDSGSGRWRIAAILPGDNTREEYRSPLGQPGLAVKAGDYVLAIDGQDLRAPTDPDRLLQTSDASQTVDLAVADSPTGQVRHVTVKPVASEKSLREAAWIAGSRATVDRLSGGRVGYIYMSDMEQLGLQQFVRQFYSQLDRQALIMDDRWNGGGFVAPLALERLRRALVVLGVNREGAVTTEPNEFIAGPKITLLNHWSASDGDIFPWLFKRYGLGPLLGTRSWGGVRGIRGEWRMMDGGYVTIPEDAMFTPDGQWGVENHGVDPDIVLENEPADLLAGHDKQLETATALMVKAIGDRKPGLPAEPPLLPPYPPDGVVAPKP